MSFPAFDIGDRGASDVATPARRNYLGWALLILFFGIYGGMATYGAVTRKPDPAERYAAVGDRLRLQIAQRNWGAANGIDLDLSKNGLGNQSSADEELKDAAVKDPDAAMAYVVLLDEEKKPIPPQPLKLLAGSKKPEHRAIAEIYSQPKLTPEEAKTISARLKGKEFLYGLARAEAAERAGDTAAKSKLVPPRVFTIALIGAAALVIGLLLGLGIWVLYAVLRSQGRLAPLGHPAGSLTLPMADNYALRAALLIGAFILSGTAIASVMTKAPGGGSQLFGIPGWAVGIGHGLLIIVLSLAVGRLGIDGVRLSAERMGLQGGQLLQKLGWAVGGFLANVPMLLVLSMLGQWLLRFLPAPEHPVNELLRSAHSPMAAFGAFFAACVQAPIFEEVMFRGLLFPALARLFRSPVAGAVTSSLLFASLHPQGPALWLALASVGLINCFVTYHSRSLIPAMMLHAIHNGAILTFTLLLY